MLLNVLDHDAGHPVRHILEPVDISITGKSGERLAPKHQTNPCFSSSTPFADSFKQRARKP